MGGSKHVGALCVLACLFLSSCSGGGGGGGGGGGSPPAAQATTLSGTAQAPGGQVAFSSPQGLIRQLAQFVSPTAYASVGGLSPVPDGTTVQLIRLNAIATSFTILASASTTGGLYFFNLTDLNLQPSNDLVVRVTNGAIQMRAFVTGSNIDIDPASEAAVQSVLEQILGTPGATINHYTIQELADITGSINVLATTKQLIASIDIATTIASIKNAVAAETGLMVFMNASAGVGQTTEGPGDIGNYFPSEQGNIWRYQGTAVLSGRPKVDFTQSISVPGVKVIGGVTTMIFRAENNNGSEARETYDAKDPRGVTNYGNNDSSDFVTPHLVPLRYVRFPMVVHDVIQVANRKGLNSGLDLDGDGIPEKVDVKLEYTVLGFEEATVPAGVFPNSVKIELRQTDTFFSSAFGVSAVIKVTQTEWLAPGIGFIKKFELIQSQGFEPDFSETITEELVGSVANGHGVGLRVQVTPTSLSTQLGLTKQLQAATFDQTNAALSGVGFIWNSTDPGIAQVAQDGTVTGIAPGTAKVTASAFGLTSNAVQVSVNDIRILTQSTGDLVYDKFTHRIYASVPNAATTLNGNANSILIIDPETATISPYIHVGDNPSKLAISDDGQFLYVAVESPTAAVKRINLATKQIDLQFSIGSGPGGLFRVDDMKVVPGSPRAVVISRFQPVVGPSHVGVAAYDDGVQRPDITPLGTPRNLIEFGATPSRLYGSNRESSGNQLSRMNLGSNGLSLIDEISPAFDGYFDAGLIYSNDGQVIDPEAGIVVAQLPGTTPIMTGGDSIRPDSSINRIFLIKGDDTSRQLLVYNRQPLGLRSSFDLSTSATTISGFLPHSLTRWGTDGLAFPTVSGVVLIRTSSLP